MMSEQENGTAKKMNGILDASLLGIREFAEVQDAVGRPILTASGMTVIPVSHISVGFAAGGFDSVKHKAFSDPDAFGGGGGSGISVTPVAFLTVGADQSVKLLTIPDQKPSALERIADLIGQAPDLIEKIKKIF